MKKQIILSLFILSCLMSPEITAQSGGKSSISFSGKPGTTIYLNDNLIGTTEKKVRTITVDNLKEGYYFLKTINKKDETTDELLNINGRSEYLYYLDEKDKQTTPNGVLTGLEKIVPIEEEIFIMVDDMPLFNGGDPRTEFLQYLKDCCEVPEGSGGTVIFEFLVTRYGYLSNINIIRSPGPEAEEQVIAALKGSPRWEPGKQNGIKVNVKYTFAVSL